MTDARALCLNMIVKNERANLARCLAAVADHVACWVVGDTGSTDGTQDFVRSFFAARGIPGELHEFPFVNFEQARNAALDCAAASALAYDYLLLADADMELVVEDGGFRAKLAAPGYRLIQRDNSGLTYWNVRLLRRDAGARYRGVTHEYLEVPGGASRLEGVWYRDHASGSNRVDKFERDAGLLKEGLEKDPDNRRYWFYLAQSYRDAGRKREAADAYAKRAAMGGWEEEAWHARLQEARCLLALNDDAGFVRQALAAFDRRPWRAEPLYDLARYYRERGMNDASVLFSEPALPMKQPKEDILFLESFVYAAGIREEYSIAANYSRDPARKDRGHAICESLALDRGVPGATRDLARRNLFFYVGPAREMMPSFSARPVGFAPPEGWKAINPSIARRGDGIVLLQRCVNYTLEADGNYTTPDGAPVSTRNFLLRLGAGLEVESSAEILPPADLPPPAFDLVLGFEDARLFAWRGGLWCVSTVRQLTPEGWCEQVLARIAIPGRGPCRLADWRVLDPEGPKRTEKNWMPLVSADALRFVYACDPARIVDECARTVFEAKPAIAADLFRGGSQAIAFDGGWLALVHEVDERNKKRFYWHRFVWFDAAYALRRTSRRFFFHAKGVEFAAGLAWHPDEKRLLVSYGANDAEAWIASVDAEDVRKSLDPGAFQLRDAGSAPDGLFAAGSRPSGRSFDLFDTLVARRCVDAREIFAFVERKGNRPGFVRARIAAEAEVSSSQYTIDDIYERLSQRLGITVEDAELLKALELETEWDNLFSIRENCREFGSNDVIVSDMYLPSRWLMKIIREKCGLPAQRLYVSANGKRSGEVWPKIGAEVKLTEHIGDNPITDHASALRAGIPARLTKVAHRTNIESELAAAGFKPLSNLIREARLTTWHNNGAFRQAQIAQTQLNFPLLFLSSLHLEKLSRERGWDHVLMSARDCYLWNRLYQRLRAFLPGAPTAEYFLTSRVTRAHPSSNYWAYLTSQCRGKRNVIVDLSGTGWSLSRLVGQSPIEKSANKQPEIFLFHRLEMEKLLRDYQRFGSLSAPVSVHSVVHRPPDRFDSEVLERMNFAPHSAVEDVRETAGGFEPIMSALQYPDELKDLIQVHHEAFEHACGLLQTLTLQDLSLMSTADVLPAIDIVYRKLAGKLSEFSAFASYKAQEEKRARFLLESRIATADGRKTTGNTGKQSTRDVFDSLAPFLRAANSPAARRDQSRAFDARMERFLGTNGAALPQIHCFYEVLPNRARHHTLIAALTSMRAAGHPVCLWSYSPEKLDFLPSLEIEVGSAGKLVPRDLFERVTREAGIRYFSNIFRYTVLYERGGLWIDSDVVLLRPFPFCGEHFLNLQWRGAQRGHFVCGNVMYSGGHSRHMRNLYELALRRFAAPDRKQFGDIGPRLLSEYVASDEGAELRDWLFSPMFFNAIDWTEIDKFEKPPHELGDFLHDERVFGVHLWDARTHAHPRDGDQSLISLLSNPLANLESLTRPVDKENLGRRHA